MKPKHFPLPKIEENCDELSGAELFTTLDLYKGYWSVRMFEPCKENTKFVYLYGMYKFQVMPFGLMDALTTTQGMMDEVLCWLTFDVVDLKDIVMSSETRKEHK